MNFNDDREKLIFKVNFDSNEPMEIFHECFNQAAIYEINDHNAMALSTIGLDGYPACRMVLLKEITNDNKFCFFTNRQSNKGCELLQNPKAALNFYWKSIRVQVRIVGDVEKASDEKSDEYFKSRAIISQIGAAASKQSRPLADKNILIESVKELEKMYPDITKMPRPNNWGGFVITPKTIEIWQSGAFRLHDRFIFTKNNDKWTKTRLYP